MGSRQDFLNANPHLFYEFEELTEPYVDTQGNGDNGVVAGTATTVPIAVHGRGVELTQGSRIELHNPHYPEMRTSENWSVVFAINPGAGEGRYAISFDGGTQLGAEGPIYVQVAASNIAWWLSWIQGGGPTSVQVSNQAITPSANGGWHIVGVSFDFTTKEQKIFVDGVLVRTETATNAAFYATGSVYKMYVASQTGDVQFDTVASYLTTLDDATMQLLTTWPAQTGEVFTPKLPLYVGTAETYKPDLPIKISQYELYTPEVPLRVKGFDESHITGATAAWRLDVRVDGSLVQLVETASTRYDEASSATADVVFIPPVGPLDPEEWENKTIMIDFIGVDETGDLYDVRRFTGVTERADFDPDNGLLTLTATADRQAKLDSMTNEAIDSFITGATFSPHVFSEDDRGFDYAESLLETVPNDVYVTPDGGLGYVAWKAKVTPDLTFTDAERFDETLTLDRARRTDIVNKALVEVDFRFPRLRHREHTVRWASSTAWCDYLTDGYVLCNKATVESAFGGSGWTLQGNITYEEIPPAGSYTCDGIPRTWIGGQDLSLFCLGATGTVARRWVQTVTETAEITVIAPDSVERVGELPVDAGYGVEATYDTDEWERQTIFDGRPSGSTQNTAGDWTLDEDNTVSYDGRDAYNTAQIAAIEREKTRILERHRRNSVQFSPIYRPDIDLSKTIRVNTPGLVCTGKVRAYRESFDLNDGDLSLDVEIALSRHGGSGTTPSDPVTPPEKPEAPNEEFVNPNTYIGYHIGGLNTSPPESDDMEGYICNALVIEDINKLYSRRFKVVLPEVESTARDAVVVTAPKTINVEIPVDELTITNTG